MQIPVVPSQLYTLPLPPLIPTMRPFIAHHLCIQLLLWPPLQDPLALVPWMSYLFALADAGLTSFDTSMPDFPFCNLVQLFQAQDAGQVQAGVQAVLGAFLKRWVGAASP